MEKYKSIFITNIINIITLILIILLHSKLIIISNILMFVWLIYTIYINYQFFIKADDLEYQLKHADKKNNFKKERSELILTLHSINAQAEFYKQYKDSGSINESYELIKQKLYSNIHKAIKYMKQYDYFLKPSTEYLDNLIKNNYELIQKLNELNELTLKVEDTTSDIDITYIDDLLSSMKELTKEGE